MDQLPTTPSSPTVRYPAWRFIFPVACLIIFLIPGWVFLSERGGLEWLSGLDAADLPGSIFPLFGLYALTLVWFQVMLGSLMPIWTKLFPKIKVFHRTEGLFALLFAVTHPTLLLIAVGLRSYLARDFVAREQVIWIYFGYAALLIMLLTISTAVMMRHRAVARWWRKIHLLNYVLFGSAWIHSYNLGSDVTSTDLEYLWYAYGVSVLAVIIYKNTKWGRAAFYAAVE